jgi:hypothetical protein
VFFRTPTFARDSIALDQVLSFGRFDSPFDDARELPRLGVYTDELFESWNGDPGECSA